MFKRVCRVTGMFFLSQGAWAAQVAAVQVMDNATSMCQDSAAFTPGYAGVRVQYEVKY